MTFKDAHHKCHLHDNGKFEVVERVSRKTGKDMSLRGTHGWLEVDRNQTPQTTLLQTWTAQSRAKEEPPIEHKFEGLGCILQDTRTQECTVKPFRDVERTSIHPDSTGPGAQAPVR